MSTFEDALAFTLGWEGGYVNDPSDPGEATAWGISSRAHPDAWENGPPTLNFARRIYQDDYWNEIRGDDLPPTLAIALFDFAVHSGVRTAVHYLQSIVGTEVVDGILGPRTLACIEAWGDAHDLAQQLNACRLNRFVRLVDELPEMRRFQRGWRNRVHALNRYLALPLWNTNDA